MARGENNPGRRRPREPEPFPGFWAGRPLTDAEVRNLGYTHRDDKGYWLNLDGVPSGGSTLTLEERRSGERQSQRLSYALRHAPHVVNEHAMSDALADAFGDRPTVGAIRRGEKVRNALHTFDWDAVRRSVDAEHAADVQRVINPTDSQQHRETRRSFSKVSGGTNSGRLGNRTKNNDRAYGIAVLDSECWRVARTPKGNRHNTLVSAAFKVGRRVGAGLVDHDEAFSNLLGAALDCGMAERRARPAIRSALRAGARHPKGAAA